MTMVDHVLREDSLKAEGNAMLLDVGLPWFRSLPISCVNGLIVTIGDRQFKSDELEIKINNQFVSMTELPDAENGEWFLQDRKQIRIPLHGQVGESHRVRVEFDMVIANIFMAPGKPVHLPMGNQAELTVS